MAENRRRSIIKRDDPTMERDDQGLYENVKDPLLERKVYIPVSLIIGGFFAIILMSFSLTYMVMTWGGDTLELPENAKLVALREAAAETTLEIRESPSARPIGARRPSAEVDVGGFRQTFPGASISAVESPERPFSRQATAGILPPVADLSQGRRTNFPDAAINPTPVPGARRAATSFERPLWISPPAVDLTPGSFTKAFEATAVPQPSQKLMMRRFAKATTFPEGTDAVNPLTIPATGQGLETRNRTFPEAFETSEPVSDLNVTRQANSNSQTTPGLEPMPESPREIDRPIGATGPVADLGVNTYPTPLAVPEGQSTDQKLLMRRYAKGAATPEAEAGNNPLTIPLEGGKVEPRTRNFSRALGLDDPATDLVLTAGNLPTTVSPTEVPDQKLMSRRFAKATSLPERLPLADPTQIAPSAAPVPSDQSIARGQDLEAWQRFAAAVPTGIEGQGRIVIIIDDMGNNSNMAARLADLDGPLNFAFLPYAPNLTRQTSNIRRSGHELLVHMPMEPTGNENPGPRALTTQLSETELLETLEHNLTRFEGFVGVNNHMGSRFTADQRRMEIVMKSLKERGLLFLDSVTTSSSMGASLARSYDIPWAGRDIFIDNEVDEGAILAQLRKVEKMANDRGIAIAIGHPHSETYRALKAWIPTLKAKGLVLVPLSSVVRTTEPRKLAGSQD